MKRFEGKKPFGVASNSTAADTMRSVARVTHREILNSCVTTLRYFGLWSPDRDSSPNERFSYAIYNKLTIVLICTFAATVLADLCRGYRDLMIVTDDGCFLAGVSVVIFKVFNFQMRREKIERLIDAVHDPVETLHRSSDPTVVRLVKSFVLYEKITVYCLTGLGSVLVLALIFFVPTESGSLPIRALYPFDTSAQPMHALAFSLQAFAIVAGIVAILAMDTLVIGFCRFTKLQLRILGSNFENCQSSLSARATVLRDVEDLGDSLIASPSSREHISRFVPFDSKEVDAMEDCFLKRFKTCVKHHQRLVGIVGDVNELFGSSMLVQLCASSSMICLTGFQAGLGAKESANLTKFALYLGAAFSQLLCWCWYGNTLIYQSQALADSQWFSGWENERDLPAVTILIIVSLIRTRMPMELTAGKFYTMSMDTFITILRSSYSFFALLTNVNDG